MRTETFASTDHDEDHDKDIAASIMASEDTMCIGSPSPTPYSPFTRKEITGDVVLTLASTSVYC